MSKLSTVIHSLSTITNSLSTTICGNSGWAINKSQRQGANLPTIADSCIGSELINISDNSRIVTNLDYIFFCTDELLNSAKHVGKSRVKEIQKAITKIYKLMSIDPIKSTT